VLIELIRGLTEFLKTVLNRIIRNAVIKLGKFAGFCFPKTSKQGIFFFFPFYHMGGAERVHLDIVNSISKSSPLVIFTEPSRRAFFRSDFERIATVCDHSRLINYRLGKLILIGYWSSIINRHANAVVFGSNTAFFYSLIPQLSVDLIKIDLIHCFGGGIENVSLPFVNSLNKRIVITPQTAIDYGNQYQRNHIDPGYLERVQLIENCIDTPDQFEKNRHKNLNVLYAGRSDEEKRTHILGHVAAACDVEHSSVNFTVIGANEECVESRHRSYFKFAGQVKETAPFYQQADILILPSRMEGFPIVVMEAMAYGVIPVCTNVGGLRFHIEDGKNGFIVSNSSERAVIEAMTRIICHLEQHPDLVERLSLCAQEYASKHFRREVFDQKYNALFLL